MEIVTLEEMKNYLRVDFDDDDELLKTFISAVESICMDVARCDDISLSAKEKNSQIAVMYAVAYLYETREQADYHQLMLSLRSLLFGVRKEMF